MTDPRMEAAQATNQAGSRGWDFRPDPAPADPFRIVLAVMGAVMALIALIGAVLA